MIRTFMFLAGLAAFGWATTTHAQVRLAHKFPDGASKTVVTNVSSEQILTIAGMEIETKSKQIFTLTSVNGKRNADGVIVIKHKLDALKADIDVAGQQLSFDSSNPDAPPPGTSIDVVLDLLKALSKSEWTAEHDRDNHVISVTGREKALEELPEGLRKGSERQFEPAYLAQTSNDEMATIPDQPVSQGDTWNVETTVRLEAGQTLTFNKIFTYDGTVRQNNKTLHRITEKTTDVAYDMQGDSGPLKYLNSDLKVADSEGVTLFDNEAGRVVSRHHKVHLVGPVTFEAGGQELPAQVDLTIQQSTQLHRP